MSWRLRNRSSHYDSAMKRKSLPPVASRTSDARRISRTTITVMTTLQTVNELGIANSKRLDGKSATRNYV